MSTLNHLNIFFLWRKLNSSWNHFISQLSNHQWEERKRRTQRITIVRHQNDDDDDDFSQRFFYTPTQSERYDNWIISLSTLWHVMPTTIIQSSYTQQTHSLKNKMKLLLPHNVFDVLSSSLLFILVLMLSIYLYPYPYDGERFFWDLFFNSRAERERGV